MGLAVNRQFLANSPYGFFLRGEVAVTRADSAVVTALLRLSELVEPSEAGAVDELLRRVSSGAFRVLVVGEAKRGKSTVVNALLQREVLPTGVVPQTAVATTVAYGRPERVKVIYSSGRSEVVELGQLAQFVTEDQNPGNVREVADVTVVLDHELLASGLELVDTPGTGSIYEHNTQAATDALAGADAALFVLTTDPPISASERAWLGRVRGSAVRVLCVLNKSDYLQPQELEQALGFTRAVLAQEFGQETKVWPVSARQAASAGVDRRLAGDGWNAFVEAFSDYLAVDQRRDLTRSVTRRAGRLCAVVTERSEAAAAALSLSQQDLQHRLEQLVRTRDEVERARFADATLARARLRQLLEGVNDDAATLATEHGPALHATLQERMRHLQGRHLQVQGEALDEAGRLIRVLVDDWRRRWAAGLEETVAGLDRELTVELNERISTVRLAAGALFSLDLPPVAAASRQPEAGRFSYALQPDVGQTELLTGAVRTRLPGRWGRRRVEQYVLLRAQDLLDRHAGRARAEFAESLTATERALLRDHEEQYAHGAGGIVAAIEGAGRVHAEQQDLVGPEREAAKARAANARELEELFEVLGRHAAYPDHDDVRSEPPTAASRRGVGT